MAVAPRPGGDDVMILDLGGGQRPSGRRSGGSLPRPQDIVGLSHRQAERARRFLQILARARWFVLLASPLLIVALGTWVLGVTVVSLGLALLGFGLSTATLLYARFSALRSLAAHLHPRARWAMATSAVAILSFLGLSSEVVLGLVLFIGGFATAGVLWGVLSRLVVPAAPAGTVRTAHPDPLPVVASGGVVVVLFTFVGLPLLLIPNQLGSWGPVVAGAEGGLVVGLLPTDVSLAREARRPTKALWFAFRARKVLRDCLFAAAVLALVARALAVAAAGGEAGPLGLALIVASYLYVLIRRIPALASPGPRPHPLLLPSFTFLLLFSPLIGLISAARSLPVVYGGAEVLGLASGLLLVFVGQAGGQWRLPPSLERIAATFGLVRRRAPVHVPGTAVSAPGLEVIPLEPRGPQPPP